MSDTKKWWEEPTKAPEIAPAPTAPNLEYKNWLDTEQGKGANTKRQEAETALNKHGDFSFLQQDWMDQVLSDIKNRPDFSYNFNEDALYQQYKDKYIKQGKMAMADTIGQASAMTGGYGNSYAQSVGQQAYQASLENLNDIVPELYQMAYDRYQQEGQDLYNQYGLLMEEYKKAYGEHSDEYQKLLTALNRADSEFYNGANLHQTEQSMANSVAQNNWQNDFSIWDANNQNAWTKAQWDESARQYAEQMALAKQQASNGSNGGNGGSGGDNNFSTSGLFTYAGLDDNGRATFYDESGKLRTYEAGVNPYTGTKHKDAKHGTFSNGYQPNNIGGTKLENSGMSTNITGKNQTIWQANGKYWVWYGKENKYIEVDISDLD